MLKTDRGHLKRSLFRARRGPPLGSVVPFALAAMGCTAFDSGSDVRLPSDGEPSGASGTAQTVVQSEQPSATSGPDWSCLGPAEESRMLLMNPAEAPRLVQSLQVLSLTTEEVLPGLSVRACAQRDIDCAEPLTPTMAPDADGWVDLPLYDGFDGYLEISGDLIVSTTLFFSAPLRADTRNLQAPHGLVEKSVLTALSGATGTVQDANLGLVYQRAFDCANAPAPGVEFSIDRPAAPWYFVDGLPTSRADQTAEGSGLGGFLNVAPGVSVVNAAIAATGAAIAPPKSVLVRGGWITGLRYSSE